MCFIFSIGWSLGLIIFGEEDFWGDEIVGTWNGIDTKCRTYIFARWTNPLLSLSMSLSNTQVVWPLCCWCLNTLMTGACASSFWWTMFLPQTSLLGRKQIQNPNWDKETSSRFSPEKWVKSNWNGTQLWSDKHLQEGGELELFPNPTGYDYNEVDLLQPCFEA